MCDEPDDDVVYEVSAVKPKVVPCEEHERYCVSLGSKGPFCSHGRGEADGAFVTATERAEGEMSVCPCL